MKFLQEIVSICLQIIFKHMWAMKEEHSDSKKTACPHPKGKPVSVIGVWRIQEKGLL